MPTNPDAKVVACQLPDPLWEAVTKVASKRGTSKAEVMRTCIEQGLETVGRKTRMEMSEARDHLDSAARRGSVNAIVKVLEILKQEEQEKQESPVEREKRELAELGIAA